MKDNSVKFCLKCRDKNILNELSSLEDSESFFCDECGKLFNKEDIEIGIGIEIDPNIIEGISCDKIKEEMNEEKI